MGVDIVVAYYDEEKLKHHLTLEKLTSRFSDEELTWVLGDKRLTRNSILDMKHLLWEELVVPDDKLTTVLKYLNGYRWYNLNYEYNSTMCIKVLEEDYEKYLNKNMIKFYLDLYKKFSLIANEDKEYLKIRETFMNDLLINNFTIMKG